ncbi:cyclin-T1-like [Saccostrea cucullata]|uniref:cyclin-T1-like n=1 Tax=Saccostrea cuccullata TaxID=36930 RepID=UPI002ED3DAF8
MAGERWIFTNSQLVNTPSRKCGIDSDKELTYRQQAANLIQDMGQKLQVFRPVHRTPPYQCCENLSISESLHLTTLCLQYKPTVVSCVCVELACKWSNWEIPTSNQGRPWYYYVDQSVTPELLTELTQDFLNILDKCPSKLKKRIMTWKSGEKDKKEREDVSVSQKSRGSSSAPSAALGSNPQSHKSSKPHHHSHSGHDKQPEKSQGKHTSSMEMSKSEAKVKTIKTELTSQTVGHTHGKNVFDAISSDTSLNVDTRESPATLLSQSTSDTSTPTVQKTSLAEYKERRERERQAAISKSASSLPNVDKKQALNKDISHRSVSSLDSDTTRKMHTPEVEKSRKSHHDKHSNKHSESVKGLSSKPYIKTEPGLDVPVQNYDSRLKVELNIDSNMNADLTRVLEVKQKVKQEISTPDKMDLYKIKVKSEPLDEESRQSVESFSKDSPLVSEPNRSSDLKMRIKTEGNYSQTGSSPLKLKIKTPHPPKEKHSGTPTSHEGQKVPPMKLSKHPSRMGSGDEHSKHKEGHHHKSHKSKHSHSHSHSSSGTNGKTDLKLRISLPKHAGDGDKNVEKVKVESKKAYESSPLVNSNNSSRKRPLSPTGVLENDSQQQQRNKMQRAESMRRSSSSLSNHSVVSMELCDIGSDSLVSENDFSVLQSPIATNVAVQKQLESLSQVIESKKAMLGSASRINPPLPPPLPPPPPPQSSQYIPPPPPPVQPFPFSSASQQYGYQPLSDLSDLDFLSDDAIPPLPGEQPPSKPPLPPY